MLPFTTFLKSSSEPLSVLCPSVLIPSAALCPCAGLQVERLAAAGIPVPCVTGGGTGTLSQDLAAGTHNELQPGSYLFMDRDYGANEEFVSREGDGPTFRQALFLHTTVVHANDETGKRVLDCGSKVRHCR